MQTHIDQRKTALVFGGSRGIGAAAVQRLAQDGFAVAFTYISRPDKAQEVVAGIEAAGGEAFAILADSADPAAIRVAVATAVKRFRVLDAIVVNAGILRLGDVEAVTLEDLEAMLAINVRGVFLAIQTSVPHVRDGGRVITIGSNTAIRTGIPGSSVYMMTKAAVATMVKGIALDLAPRSITVNNVQPGPTETEMTAGVIEHLVDRIPLHRVAQPAEIAALVSYIAGPESGYMTGTSLTIDGGFVL